MTLTEIARRTKISYPTLLRYVKTSLGKIPHVGAGRRRRFRPDAVAVFERLRSESRRGRPPGSKARRGGRSPGSGLGRVAGAQVSRLTGMLERLEKRLRELESELKKPLKIVRG